VVHAVVQYQEWQAEDPEGVLGPQFPVVVEVDVQFLGEAVHGEGGEVSGTGVDVGQVMAGVFQFAAAGEHQPATGAGAGYQVAVKLPCGTGKPTLTHLRPSCR